MTYAPGSLNDLRDYWEAHGGAFLGIVGNAVHTAGYHLGKDRIYSSTGLGDRDYSVQLSRDKAGLTNAAAAIDLGKLNGSYKQLRKFSSWLVAQCQASPTARRDVREIIYSPDGVNVQRYSGPDNTIYTGPFNGDDSHLTHTHISYYRDSQSRDKVALFAPYFGESMGLRVRFFVTSDGDPYDALVTAKVKPTNRVKFDLETGEKTDLPDNLDLGVCQLGEWDEDLNDTWTPIIGFSYGVGVNKRYVVVRQGAVDMKPLPKPECPECPPEVDCTPLVDAARQEGYNDGYDTGKTEGYSSGHADGYALGKDDGQTVGYEQGQQDEYDRQVKEATASVNAVVHLSPRS